MKIDTGVPRPDLVLNQIPRERWESVAVARSLWAEIDFPHDCRLMKQVADEADLLAEELGYENGEAFIVEYLSTRQVRRSCCASEASYRLQPLVSMREIRRCFKSKNQAVAVQDGAISRRCDSCERQVLHPVKSKAGWGPCRCNTPCLAVFNKFSGLCLAE